MFQFRGLSDDPWAATQPDVWGAISSVGSSIKSSFTLPDTVTVPGAVITSTQPTPGTTATAVTPIKPPWYKTPIGMLAIAAGVFVGWKYGLPKLRK